MMLRRTGRSERGAGLVEYGMLAALVALLLVAGADHLASSGRDELDSRGRTAAASGEPIGSLGPGAPTTPTTVGSGSGDPGDAISGGTVAALSADPPIVQGNGKWDVTVSVAVVDDEGQPLRGARVTGSWTGNANKADTLCAATADDGGCTFTYADINKNTDTVTFTVESVTYTNPDGETVELTWENGSIIVPKTSQPAP